MWSPKRVRFMFSCSILCAMKEKRLSLAAVLILVVLVAFFTTMIAFIFCLALGAPDPPPRHHLFHVRHLKHV